MSSTAALRPGIALGPYPQREDLRDGVLDRAAASIGGCIRPRVSGRNPGHEAFLARVNAEGERLAGQSAGAISDGLHALRRSL